MKKGIVLPVSVVLLMLLCAVPIQAWQGRTGAMGNASGLVEDESDFLIHPAAIAGGKGLNFYGNLGFKNSWIDKFSFSTSIINPATSVSSTMVSEAAGKEWQLDGLTGFAFPVGTGRMGVFFQYTGVDGTLNGDQIRDWSTGVREAYSFDIENKIDDLALRFLYAVPFGANMKLGGEFQIGQKTEKYTSFIGNLRNIDSYSNAAYGPWGDDVTGLLQYGVPRDSQYYEASLKASVEAKMGPATAAFTARGGMPVGGTDNHYVHERFAGSVSTGGADMYGKVKGYNVGADAWVRLPLTSSLTLPFLVKFDFKDMKRDGDGPEFGGWGVFGNWRSMYENKDKSMTITAGGGADFTPAKDARIAGGLYYTYLNTKTTYNFAENFFTSPNWTVVRNSGYPETKEHKISLKLSGEKALSSEFTVNGGFNAFYGWVKQGYNYDFHNSAVPGTAAFDTSLKGKHWGLGASLGLSMLAGATTFEPYIAGGLERYNLSGDGVSLSNGAVTRLITDSALKRNVLSIVAGIALRY
jgi:hypothetical protein